MTNQLAAPSPQLERRRKRTTSRMRGDALDQVRLTINAEELMQVGENGCSSEVLVAASGCGRPANFIPSSGSTHANIAA